MAVVAGHPDGLQTRLEGFHLGSGHGAPPASAQILRIALPLSPVGAAHHTSGPAPSDTSTGDAALQFFKPVEHDVDLRGLLFLLAGLQHEKSLAVGYHTEGGCARLIPSLKQYPGLAYGQSWLRCEVHSHHLVAVAVEQ